MLHCCSKAILNDVSFVSRFRRKEFSDARRVKREIQSTSSKNKITNLTKLTMRLRKKRLLINCIYAQQRMREQVRIVTPSGPLSVTLSATPSVTPSASPSPTPPLVNIQLMRTTVCWHDALQGMEEEKENPEQIIRILFCMKTLISHTTKKHTQKWYSLLWETIHFLV